MIQFVKKCKDGYKRNRSDNLEERVVMKIMKRVNETDSGDDNDTE